MLKQKKNGQHRKLEVHSDEDVLDVVTSCSPRHDRQGKYVSLLCVGQNMDSFGGPAPQISRKLLAQACALSLPRGSVLEATETNP